MKSSYLKSLLLASTCVIAFTLAGCGGESTSSNSTVTESVEHASSAEDASSAETEEGLAFPYEAKDGKLVFNSVFPSDIENPDCNNEYKDGAGSIEFKNVSEEYLQSITLVVTMADGSVRTFYAADIPSEATCWAFEKDNQTVDLEQDVADISYDPVYGTYANSVMDMVAVVVNGTTISITNNSDQELSGLQVICHDDMGDAFFGGASYKYAVDYIGIGDTVSVEAAECMLGANVVDVVKE